MRAKVILCEAATAHPDATFSLLRGGLNLARSGQTPIPFRGSLVVRIESDAADLGGHQFDIRCMNEDGKLVMPPVGGTFETPEGGGVNNILMGLEMAFPAEGNYAFFVRVDNVELDRWSMKAVVVEPPQPPEPPEETGEYHDETDNPNTP